MIFNEIYGVYYNAVAKILKEAVDHPLQKNELREIIRKITFEESVFHIEPALYEGRWQLLKEDGTTPIRKKPTMPLTTIQKRWMKAISLDVRMKLFQDEILDFPDVEPLFTKEDYDVFDRYADGDPYEDRDYRLRFRIILDAIRNHDLLEIEMENKKGNRTRIQFMPKYLEYSEKDDKFRLIGSGKQFVGTVNLGRILSCKRYEGVSIKTSMKKRKAKQEKVVFELVDQRNALDRVLLHFANFEKQAERLEGNRYRITVNYDKEDETEMVIRILSFGPMVKVVAPDYFINLIKKRLLRQKSCEQ